MSKEAIQAGPLVFPLDRAALFITRTIASVLEYREIFSLVLSGGSSPLPVFRELAFSNPDWKRIHLFWADERCVPPTDPSSNYGVALRLLIKPARISPDNVHRIRAELPPGSAAAEYEKEVRKFFAAPPPEIPVFDLILLGTGQDGHTASLFPEAVDTGGRQESSGLSALNEAGAPRLKGVKSRFVLNTRAPEGTVAPERITLDFPVLNNARQVAFIVTGRRKRSVIERIMAGDRRLPAARIQSRRPIRWFLGPELYPFFGGNQRHVRR